LFSYDSSSISSTILFITTNLSFYYGYRVLFVDKGLNNRINLFFIFFVTVSAIISFGFDDGTKEDPTALKKSIEKKKKELEDYKKIAHAIRSAQNGNIQGTMSILQPLPIDPYTVYSQKNNPQQPFSVPLDDIDAQSLQNKQYDPRKIKDMKKTVNIITEDFLNE